MLVLAGCGKKETGTGEGEISVPVRVAKVEKGTLADTAVVSGKLEALAASDVVPGGQGGKVYTVNVKLGDRVSKGQTLVTLEYDALAAAVQQAEQGVAQAEAALQLAKITYEQAKANYERGKQLYESGAIPLAGQTGFETAFEIPYKQAKIDYEQIKPAALETARAALVMAKENYNHAFIRSPISGVVTAINVDPGELASPASPVPVVSVVNLDKVVVNATVTEGQINKIKQGQKVPVLVSAVSAEPFTGVITNIALAADPVSKAYPIKVQIDNPEHIIKPGMFAEVHLTSEKKETLIVPREAVVKIGGRDTVWVVEENRAASRVVAAGISDGEKIEIKEGVEAGQQVVVSGQDTLKENAPVEIKQ
jgi:cobalt-zinc-cadmium efflux system membrane fusion protein